jgi:metal-responsive CopG/Arc/MetJ family transcriptional regulator
MKHKLSISIEEDIILRVFDRMRSKEFRNKSHFFETAAAKMLEEKR